MEFENKAKLAEAEGDYLSAIKYYQQALDSLNEMKITVQFQYDIGNIQQRLAGLYCETGNIQQALKSYQAAIHSFSESEEPVSNLYRLIGECYTCMGACYISLANFRTAIEYFQKAIDQFEKATQLEEPILQKYVMERAILNIGFTSLCLMKLKQNPSVIESVLEKAKILSSKYNVTGFARNLNFFLKAILAQNYGEARLTFQNHLEDAVDALLLPSALQATIMGLLLDLLAKHVPEAKYQVQDQIINEKGEVLLTMKLYEDLLLYSLSFASAKIPKEAWREVMALVVGKLAKDDVVITEIVPILSGTSVEFEFKEEHYTKAAIVDSTAAERNEFVVGWFHTHPGLGLFLSPTDVLNQLGYQAVNPKAIAIVFDFKKIQSTHPGFAIYRLDDPTLGAAAQFHMVRWRITDASVNDFTTISTVFDQFIMTLTQIVQKQRRINLSDLAEKLDRSEELLLEIIPQLIHHQLLSQIRFDSETQTLSAY